MKQLYKENKQILLLHVLKYVEFNRHGLYCL